MYSIVGYLGPPAEGKTPAPVSQGIPDLEDAKSAAESIARSHGVTGLLGWHTVNDGTRKGHSQVYQLNVFRSLGSKETGLFSGFAVHGPTLYEGDDA
jgi:hypothetical protein